MLVVNRKVIYISTLKYTRQSGLQSAAVAEFGLPDSVIESICDQTSIIFHEKIPQEVGIAEF
jgi:hypothetical protein